MAEDVRKSLMSIVERAYAVFRSYGGWGGRQVTTNRPLQSWDEHELDQIYLNGLSSKNRKDLLCVLPRLMQLVAHARMGDDSSQGFCKYRDFFFLTLWLQQAEVWKWPLPEREVISGYMQSLLVFSLHQSVYLDCAVVEFLMTSSEGVGLIKAVFENDRSAAASLGLARCIELIYYHPADRSKDCASQASVASLRRYFMRPETRWRLEDSFFKLNEEREQAEISNAITLLDLWDEI